MPLAEPVAFALAERLRSYPARKVTLPFGCLDGPLQTRRLIFTTRESWALNRTYFNQHTWKPARGLSKL